MNKQEQKRIDLLKTIVDDETLIEVGFAVTIMTKTFMEYFERTKTGHMIIDKLSNDEFTMFCTGMLNTMSSTLYVCAGKTQEDVDERVRIVEDANKDVIAAKIIIEKDEGEYDA